MSFRSLWVIFFILTIFLFLHPLNSAGAVPETGGFSRLISDSSQILSVAPGDTLNRYNQLKTVLGEGNLIPEYNRFTFSFSRLLRGLLGILTILFIAFLLSENKRKISWKIVIGGIVIQVLLAIGILQVPLIKAFFEFGGKVFVKILDFTDSGTQFLFSSFDSQVIEQPLRTFAFTILPTIIFFSALTSVLFYFGIIQKVVWVLAWMMTKVFKVSGAESLSVAGNIFLGQTEAPLLIKAYLEKMTRSEMLLVMSGGMATMAGGVLALYIDFLGGDSPEQKIEFARHLLAASVMAAPGVVVISKILIPQTESIDTEVRLSQDRIGTNVLDSVNKGTYDGLKLAVNVGAMLIVFLAFIAMLNFLFGKFGDWSGINDWVSSFSSGRYQEFSLQFLFGFIFTPLMWMIGVPAADILLVGSLLGEKLVMTELVGYVSLAELKSSGFFQNPKSIIMSTYILCGFANFASVGIQIGGIGAIAPGKKVLLARLGMKSLLAGTLASLLSATIVGIILA